MHSHRSSVSIFHAVRTCIDVMRRRPALVIPLVVFVAIDAGTLLIAYYSVFPPLKMISGVLLRTFGGERFLHYPDNFLLLPSLYGYGRSIVAFVLGTVLPALTVHLLHQAVSGTRPELRSAVLRTARRIVPLAAIGGTGIFALVLFEQVAVHAAGPTVIFFLLLLVLTFLAQVFLSAASVPVLLHDRTARCAAAQVFSFMRQNRGAFLGCVGACLALLFPAAYLQGLLPQLVRGSEPDMVLHVYLYRAVTVGIVLYIATSLAALLVLLDDPGGRGKTP